MTNSSGMEVARYLAKTGESLRGVQMKFFKTVFLLFAIPIAAMAAEGMWQPHQLPELGEELKRLGLKIEPEALADLNAFPMNAIVSLGGCSASFVSPRGLVVSNHHCVYGSIQYNSSPDNNLLADGFLARSLEDELPAAPGTRVYVTESLTDVSEEVLSGVSDDDTGLERQQRIQANIKALVRECESTGIHRCDVPAFHHGLQYFLNKRLEIRDVRLVYAPALSIGKYGGDIDNWQWPRHTGDFGFYRAYVGRDGKPADHSPDNVPYQPAGHLKINATDLQADSFVMAAGYPGSTNRYRTALEVAYQFDWFYPTAKEMRENLIRVIKEHSAPDSQARINYESTIASLANYAKNYGAMIKSYEQSDFLERRQQFELAFSRWLEAESRRQQRYGPVMTELNELIVQEQSTRERDLILSYFNYATMPTVAAQLYRFALERELPDAEREMGYQERDLQPFREALQRINRRYDPGVEQAILFYLLQRYQQLPPEQRVVAIDQFFGLDQAGDEAAVAANLKERLASFYQQTQLDQEAVRLEWMEKTPEDFRNSDDPFIRFAVATHDARMALEREAKDLAGNMQKWRSRYMEALINFKQSQGEPVYADANGTLRVTFGQVKGNEPRDGLRNLPFTTLEGIVEKNTGEEPFNAPEKELELIHDQHYGPYKLAAIGSVPVNFLSTLDVTGGNSGSAILNDRAQLVGLLFDSVYEGIIGDWDFDENKNRSISVDIRYMLWVMEYVDEAKELLAELSIQR